MEFKMALSSALRSAISSTKIALNHFFMNLIICYALWFYEDDPFPLMQCFWPDKEGRFPWDDGCDDYVRNAQPLLFVL
jgi:uncharacterized protein DUF4262